MYMKMPCTLLQTAPLKFFFLCWYIQDCFMLSVASVYLNLLELIQFHEFHVQLKTKPSM